MGNTHAVYVRLSKNSFWDIFFRILFTQIMAQRTNPAQIPEIAERESSNQGTRSTGELGFRANVML